MAVIVFFGAPGTGKTTMAAKIVAQNAKRGIRTYSNVDIIGSVPIKKDDLGVFQIEDGDIVLDEAGIEFNNRNYKSLPAFTIEYLKTYRHYGVRDIYVFSQSYEDMDITIRRLATSLYVMNRTLIPGLFCGRQIRMKIGIDKDTHQIQDQYFFRLLNMRFAFGPRYFGLFDSWEHKKLRPMVRNYLGSQIPAQTDPVLSWSSVIKRRMLLYRIAERIKKK